VAFERCFIIEWVTHPCPNLAGQHVAIDGKTVRGDASNGRNALHVVSAWCSDNGLSLGQIATAGKSNEITAIAQLLEALDLSGATVTIDAMGRQHEIAQAIIDAGADYVLPMVKDNQPTLAENLREWLASAQAGELDLSY
jgi:hypothetical protein